MNSVQRTVWLVRYDLERARQLHAARHQLFREAAAAIALGLLRLARIG